MKMKETFRHAPWPLKGLFFLFIGLLYILVFSSIVYFLWNAILPKVSPLSEITLLQAAGILILSKILFGAMNFSKMGRSGNSRKQWGERPSWKNKWHSMSEDDKIRMKERWKERCSTRKQQE
jgi:hypothetical protein